MAIEVAEALGGDALLGEGVVWDAARKVVWFVDIKRHQLWHLDPATGSNAMAEAPGQIGWAIPTGDGPLLCGLQDGLYLFDPEKQTFDFHAKVPGEPSGNRLNDACTDPWGRVWFGSMDDAESADSGRFYVYDRGDIRAAGPTGIAITNGPAVNAAGDRIYFTDTTAQRIMVADLSANGVGEARTFVATSDAFPDAYPDGPVVDAEDHVWTGLYLGNRVARYSPEGELVDHVELPVRDITKMAFGGPDLSTAYVTTATKNLTDDEKAGNALAGSLLRFDAPVRGFVQARAKLG